MAIQETQLKDLPEEIIRFILSKLSLKTLTISSCVQTNWLRIIKDINFSKFYLKLNSEQKTLRSRLMVTTSTGIHTLSPLDLRGVYDSSYSSSNGRRLYCPFDEAGHSVKLLGTSNGLVFAALNSYKNFYIWNPSTGVDLKLPDPEEFEGRKEYHLDRTSGQGSVTVKDNYKIHHRGFGYVSATDDYKAFVTIYCESNMWVLVYSVKSQTWTKIENPYKFFLLKNTYTSHMEGILINEKLHWLHKYTSEGPYVGRFPIKYPDDFADELKEELKVLGVLVFDLAENNFRKITFPAAVFADDDKEGSYRSLIGVSDGCLCLMRYEGKSINHVDFWVMRKYDVSESWTRLFRVNIYKRPEERIIRYLHPLLVMETTILIKARFAKEDRLIRIDMEQDDPPEAYFEKPGFAFHTSTTLVYQETPVFLEKQNVKIEKVSEKEKDLSKKRKCRT